MPPVLPNQRPKYSTDDHVKDNHFDEADEQFKLPVRSVVQEAPKGLRLNEHEDPSDTDGEPSSRPAPQSEPMTATELSGARTSPLPPVKKPSRKPNPRPQRQQEFQVAHAFSRME
jgi:hypothetical protein